MIIFIDGYNILRGAGYHFYQNNKSFFISTCARYARKKGHKMILVFDGGPWTSPVSDVLKGVCEIVETGINLSADDYLVTRITQAAYSEIVLVTADRGIISALASCSITIIEPALFCTFLNSYVLKENERGILLPSPTQVYGDSTQNFDAFMERITQDVYTKDESLVTLKKNNRDSKEKTLSKKERALRKILRKL